MVHSLRVLYVYVNVLFAVSYHRKLYIAILVTGAWQVRLQQIACSLQ